MTEEKKPEKVSRILNISLVFLLISLIVFITGTMLALELDKFPAFYILLINSILVSFTGILSALYYFKKIDFSYISKAQKLKSLLSISAGIIFISFYIFVFIFIHTFKMGDPMSFTKAKQNLGLLYSRQMKSHSEHGRYFRDFKEIAWKPEGYSKFAYFLSPEISIQLKYKKEALYSPPNWHRCLCRG